MQGWNSQTTAKAWSSYIDEDRLDLQTVRQAVATSWARCRALEIDPYGTVNLPTPQLELRERLHRRCHLVKIALPFMQNLYNFVKGSGFQVILADEEGYLLEVVGDPDILAKTRQVQLSPGGNWAEESKGTNAIGTAIVERKPVQIHAWEHYCQANHFLTCSAAPIFDPEGRLLGALDITGDYRFANAHTLGMVVAAVNAIENQLRLQKTTASLYVAYRYSNTLLESMSDGLVSINTGGIITELNSTGGRILGIHPNTAKGRHINDVPAGAGADAAAADLRRGVPGQGDPPGDAGQDDLQLRHPAARRRRPADRRRRGAAGRPPGDPERDPAPPLLFRRHHRHQRGDQRSQAMGRAGGGDALNRPAQWRERHRQGTLRPSDSQCQPAVQRPFRRAQLRRLAGNSDRKRTVRLRGGGLHRRPQGGQTGKFELSHGGSIFLDEIGDMPLGVQAKLLRVIQEKKIARVGSSRELPVDIRIIAATHRDLAAEVRAGRFREDLYYRLNVVAIRIPALRERKEDLPLLARQLLERVAAKLGRELQAGDDFLGGLAAHHWPGNVRELENTLERAALRAGEVGVLTADHLVLDHPAGNTPPIPATASLANEPVRSLKEVEKEAISHALAKHAGNISQAATDLGIGRNTLYRKIKEYGLSI